MKRITKIVVLVSILILLFLGWTFLFSSDGEPISMGQIQSKSLNERDAKSIDIQKRNTKKIKVIQQGEVKIIDRNSVQIDSLKLILDDNIGTASLIEAENYLIVRNFYISSNGNNISKYSKDGKFISSFGRKGRGPGEIIRLDAVSEVNHQVFISDNAYLKIFNRNDSTNQVFDTKSWAYRIGINSNNIDLQCSYSEVFAFPIVNINRYSGVINFVIKDTRKDVMNFQMTASTLFASNDTILYYAKTTEPTIYSFSKRENKFITDYELISEMVRINEKSLAVDKITKEELTNFMTNLWQIEDLTLIGNRLIGIISDTQTNSSRYSRKLYLFTFDLNSVQSDGISLLVYDLTNINPMLIKLYKNKLYWSGATSDEGYIKYYSINLKEIIK